ncbi:MAG: hypothetical protein LBQ66_02580 [Planctomycetaceae bacterium]|nr:hypothetical protein [Planctomycetaceae bacterium]
MNILLSYFTQKLSSVRGDILTFNQVVIVCGTFCSVAAVSIAAVEFIVLA